MKYDLKALKWWLTYLREHYLLKNDWKLNFIIVKKWKLCCDQIVINFSNVCHLENKILLFHSTDEAEK